MSIPDDEGAPRLWPYHLPGGFDEQLHAVAKAFIAEQRRERREREIIASIKKKRHKKMTVEAESPKQYLLNWREIFDALKLKSNNENRTRVRKLAEQYEGPIIFGKKGSQPKVEQGKLLGWWNSLEKRFAEIDQRQKNRAATSDITYEYGRDGTVAPEIGGSVRRRRSKRSK